MPFYLYFGTAAATHFRVAFLRRTTFQPFPLTRSHFLSLLPCNCKQFRALPSPQQQVRSVNQEAKCTSDNIFVVVSIELIKKFSNLTEMTKQNMSFPRNALTLIKSHSSKTHDLDFSSSELPRDAKPPPLTICSTGGRRPATMKMGMGVLMLQRRPFHVHKVRRLFVHAYCISCKSSTLSSLLTITLRDYSICDPNFRCGVKRPYIHPPV